MQRVRHIRLMAGYNTWMNAKVYDAVEKLPGSVIMEDQGAFFGSIFRTLNHIVLGDAFWLKFFCAHPRFPAIQAEIVGGLPVPTNLSEIAFPGSRTTTFVP